MKPSLLILLVGFSLQLSAQQIFPTKLKNVKTKKHIRIASTRFSIVPPAGFHNVPGFIGMEKNDSVLIQFIDQQGGDYTRNVNSLMQMLINTTDVIEDSGDAEVGSFKAKFLILYAKPLNNQRRYFLLFGDTSFIATVYAECQLSDSLLNLDIIHAMQSVYFDKELKFDPFEVATFTIDDSKSTFKYSDFTAGTFIYTLEGKKIGTIDQTSSYVNIGMRFWKDTSATMADMGEINNYKVKYNVYKVKSLSTQPINGYPAEEMVMYGIRDRKQILIYLLLMVHGQTAILLLGDIRSDHENQLTDIRKLAATIKFKE